MSDRRARLAHLRYLDRRRLVKQQNVGSETGEVVSRALSVATPFFSGSTKKLSAREDPYDGRVPILGTKRAVIELAWHALYASGRFLAPGVASVEWPASWSCASGEFEPAAARSGVFSTVTTSPLKKACFAIAVCLNQAGLFSWAEWVEVFSKEIKDTESTKPGMVGQYYHTWFSALEKLVVDRQMLDKHAIDSKQKYLRDNPPPHDHHAHRAPIAIG